MGRMRKESFEMVDILQVLVYRFSAVLFSDFHAVICISVKEKHLINS